MGHCLHGRCEERSAHLMVRVAGLVDRSMGQGCGGGEGIDVRPFHERGSEGDHTASLIGLVSEVRLQVLVCAVLDSGHVRLICLLLSFYVHVKSNHSFASSVCLHLSIKNWQSEELNTCSVFFGFFFVPDRAVAFPARLSNH